MVCFETYNVQLQEMRGRLIEDAKRTHNELSAVRDKFYKGGLDEEQRKPLIQTLKGLKYDLTRIEGAINHVQQAIYEITGHTLDYPRYVADMY